MAEETTTTGPKCTQCDEPATFAYQWDWGEKGVVCSTHATLLQQTAGQLSRTVQITPLVPAAGAPLQRDERTQLKAAALVLEEELEEAKSRGLDLYRQVQELTRTNHGLTVREREAKAQLKDRELEVINLQGKLEERDAEHGELVAEIERLRALEKLVTPTPPFEPAPEPAPTQ